MMTWMVWAVAVAALLGASAHLAEWALRERGHQARWVWTGALAVSWGLPGWGWLRPAQPVEAAPPSGGEGWSVVDPTWLVDLGTTTAVRGPWTSDAADAVLGGLWMISALVATLALFGGLRGLRLRARHWSRTRVEGELVLVSQDFGPALVGIVHPRIVLPAWAFSLPSEDLRMACLHEAEHRDAGDSRLLLLGALLVSLAPWNPALWWQLKRLRLAVEVDCDARVLRRGTSRRAYGRLLLELGAAQGRYAMPTLGFAKRGSLLERRMKMMLRKTRTHGPVPAAVAMGLSAMLFVVACDAAPPTNLEETDVSGEFVVEETSGPANAAGGIRTPGNLGEVMDGRRSVFSFEGARVLVDGEEVEGVPTDLDAGRIERVEVLKPPVGGPEGTVHVFTRAEAADPVVYMDGERFEGDLSQIRPELIERVEVLKGEAALQRFGEDGAPGVILVTTKEAAGSVVRR